ncbi:hypothetical protein [Thermoactinospora rubra]|uniref:hypothetical protein n=1 Tax=Thermoactinospora rubra TaxID=1088767 RepID=UPI000A109E12|nr:hypothetical protein [Thermoactinospora rubra]
MPASGPDAYTPLRGRLIVTNGYCRGGCVPHRPEVAEEVQPMARPMAAPMGGPAVAPVADPVAGQVRPVVPVVR